ncbi:MAG: hypothetical protein WC566_13045 [Dehalococcoidia bacterium]
MEYKKAIAVMMKFLDKYPLDDEEKEAVAAAIGVLDSAVLAENRMKSMIKAKKAKRNEDMKW